MFCSPLSNLRQIKQILFPWFSRVSQLKFEANRSRDSELWLDIQTNRDNNCVYGNLCHFFLVFRLMDQQILVTTMRRMKRIMTRMKMMMMTTTMMIWILMVRMMMRVQRRSLWAVRMISPTKTQQRYLRRITWWCVSMIKSQGPGKRQINQLINQSIY